MVTARTTGMIRIDDVSFDYIAANSVAAALQDPYGFDPCVTLDLAAARSATTAGLARLVLLRRHLLAAGRDLRLTGLDDFVSEHVRINRLTEILPIAC